MSNSIQLEEVDGVLIIRFIRPELRNPLSISVLDELDLTLDKLKAQVHAIIFTGTKDVFASGADLREVAHIGEQDAKAFASRGQSLMVRVAGLNQLTIAAINGYCFGGALDLSLACDTRIASPRAMFAHPGAGLGIITGWGGTQRLPALIGATNALEMFFTASPVTAARALSIGLIDRVDEDPLGSSIEAAISHL
jgi:enoyl-CoA hydratase/carnithine racemase